MNFFVKAKDWREEQVRSVDLPGSFHWAERKDKTRNEREKEVCFELGQKASLGLKPVCLLFDNVLSALALSI